MTVGKMVNPEYLLGLSDNEFLDVLGPGAEASGEKNGALRVVTPEAAADARYRTTQDQVAAAVDTLLLSADAFKRMPWPSLDREFVGNIAPGKLWYWVIASNNGKTLAVRSFVEEKIAANERTHLVSTETSPQDFRMALACHELGIYPGDLLTGEYLAWDNAAEVRAAVKRVMSEATLYERQKFDLLQFPSENGLLTPALIRHAAEEAAEQEADWFIVDHVDYLTEMAGQPEVAVSNAVNAALDEIRRRFPFRVIATSQLNQRPFDRYGRLTLLTPPVEDWVKYGGVKKQNADGMLCAYRPLKDPEPDEDVMKAFKAGHRPVEDVAMPGAMRWRVMKHRDYGERVGRAITLEVHKGRLREPTKDTAGYVHGIRTARGLV